MSTTKHSLKVKFFGIEATASGLGGLAALVILAGLILVAALLGFLPALP